MKPKKSKNVAWHDMHILVRPETYEKLVAMEADTGLKPAVQGRVFIEKGLRR